MSEYIYDEDGNIEEIVIYEQEEVWRRAVLSELATLSELYNR